MDRRQPPRHPAPPPPTGLTLTPTQLRRIHLLDTVHEDIAATTLRHHLATHPASYASPLPDDLLPPP
jgi:hypothetical protein